MKTDADQNPFASPRAAQADRDTPLQIEGATPLDVRGFCYACGAPGDQDFQQSFYWGRLLVDYSLCQNCLWRRPWQRASLLVNGSLTIAGFLIAGYAVILVRLILGDWSNDFARLLASLGIVVAIATGFLVLANIVLRLFAVFHWYPTSVGRGVYRLTSLNRNFAENYFRRLAEEE
ncbi:hypothetical protein [Blastopirellula marina]|uniref:Uncharacterized protein n=1 Tax=Blastopirellula marina DSM 3645 TaxID=314230 RepID=A4A1V8_9BACT|nr:hypothetical protein [Blastopirellula marina]EAQ77248.1 hypothetical protein DSM3645_13400 [Blastopirellula marina DSM 3645]